MRRVRHQLFNARRFLGIALCFGGLALIAGGCGSGEDADQSGWSVTPSANGTCIEEGAGGDNVCRSHEDWQNYAREVCARHNLVLTGIEPAERCDASTVNPAGTDPNDGTQPNDPPVPYPGEAYSKIRFTCCAGPGNGGGGEPSIAICEGMELVADQCADKQHFEDYAQRACSRDGLSVRALRPLEACATGDEQMRRAYLICCDDQTQPPPPSDRCTSVRGETQQCVDFGTLNDLAARKCEQLNMHLQELKPLEQCTDASGLPGGDPAAGQGYFRDFEALCCADGTVPPPPPNPECQEVKESFNECLDEQQLFDRAHRQCEQLGLQLMEAQPVDSCENSADNPEGQRGYRGLIAKCCGENTPPPPPPEQCQQFEQEVNDCLGEQELREAANDICAMFGGEAREVRGFQECGNQDGQAGYSAVAVSCCFGDVMPPPPPLPTPEPQCTEFNYGNSECVDEQMAWISAEQACHQQGMYLQDLVLFGECATSDANERPSYDGFRARCCVAPDGTASDDPNQP